MDRVTGFIVALVLAALVPLHPAHSVSRGMSVELKTSEAPGAPSGGTVQLYSKSYALIIGNDSYRDRAWGRLSNGINDARRVAKALEARGFEVTLKTDLSSVGLREALKDFFIKKGRDEDARLFVWYAGHGATVDGEGYLIPTDGASPFDEVAFLDSAISLRDFGTFVRYARSKHVFTVFDSCFAGTIFNVARSGTPPAITRVTTEPVRQFLSSGDAGQEVSDDGVFARLFIEALAGRSRADINGDGYLTGSEIGAHMTYWLSNVTNNKQTPRGGKLRSTRFDKGDFVFKLAALPPSGDATPGEGSSTEVVFWQSVQASDDAAMFAEYLRQYPSGKFAGLARLKIRTLQGQQTASLTPPTAAVEPLDETYVIARTANLRSAPDVKSRKLTTLPADTGVQATGKTRDGKWIRIAHSGADAFIWGALVQPVDASELSAWDKVKDSRSGTELKGFLSDYPSGHFAPRARRLMAVFLPPAQPDNFRPGRVFRDCADCPEMIVIPAGHFTMGTTEEERDWAIKHGVKPEYIKQETPRHRVDIDYTFAVGKHEVTKGQFAKFIAATGDNAGYKCGVWDHRNNKWRDEQGLSWQNSEADDHPVVCVDWNAAQSYVDWLSRKTGQTYRLLSESEWEYAARAGTDTMRYWDDDRDNRAACWYGNVADETSGLTPRFECTDGSKYTAGVGKYRGNAFGLYDMLGNVWELVEDCWNGDYVGAPTDGSANTSGDCDVRMLRGGAWSSSPVYLRSAFRDSSGAAVRYYNTGFRIARDL